MVTSTGSISDGLSADFYGSTSGVVSPEDLAAFNVALDGRQYFIDLQKYQRTILDSQTPQSDDAAEVGEKSLSRAGFWAREQTDWSLGAGQELFDAPESSRLRFEKSRGADVWDRRRLSMLHTTALRLANASTNLGVFSVGGYLYFVAGTFLRFTTDPDVAVPSFTVVSHINTIIDWTTDGDRIYTAFGGANVPKVVTVGSGAAPTLFGATTPDIIEFANGRLIAADGATLFELDSAGAKVGATNIRVDPRAGAAWVAVTGAPSAIFAALNIGDVSEIYATTVNDTTTALTAPTYAGGLPFGETVRCLSAYPPGRLVVIGTSKGLRVALVDGLTLHIGELIEIAGGVNAVDVRDRFCWFTWSDPQVDTTGIGRADLSVGTSDATFVPAYAEDLQAQGVAGVVSGVASFRKSGAARDRRYFTVIGAGLFGEADELVEQATIESGQVRFGVLPDKIFTGVEVRHEPVPGSIGAAITYDDGGSSFLGGGDTHSSTMLTLDAGGSAGLSASLALFLTRDTVDLTKGPVVLSWVLSALPQPKRVTDFVVPIILKSRVTDLRGHDRTFDPLAEVRRLEALASTSRLVVYQEGADTRRVRVSSVAIAEGDVRSWRKEPGEIWFEATVLVRLLSRES